MFSGFSNKPFLSKQDLQSTSENELKRFADYLKLKTEGYSHKQRAKLVYWLLSRRNKYSY